MDKIISIIDKYISPKILPAEDSSCWIKWKKGEVFDKIVLRYEADIAVFRLFNIDEKIFECADKHTGKIVIPKDMIQIDGFFGFSSRYTATPPDERKISYEIDVISGDDVQTIHFENTVTRPMLKVLKASPDSIRISKYAPQPEHLSLKIESAGTAALYDLSCFVELSTSDKLTVEVTAVEPKSKEITLKPEQLDTQNISIAGKGSGMIRMGVEYYDDYRTKYTDIFKEIPIIVEYEDCQTIPISGQIEKQETELLVPN